ncbi:hypothetical protein GCM10023347_40710 [Streptomyces chumphonensis]
MARLGSRVAGRVNFVTGGVGTGRTATPVIGHSCRLEIERPESGSVVREIACGHPTCRQRLRVHGLREARARRRGIGPVPDRAKRVGGSLPIGSRPPVSVPRPDGPPLTATRPLHGADRVSGLRTPRPPGRSPAGGAGPGAPGRGQQSPARCQA